MRFPSILLGLALFALVGCGGDGDREMKLFTELQSAIRARDEPTYRRTVAALADCAPATPALLEALREACDGENDPLLNWPGESEYPSAIVLRSFDEQCVPYLLRVKWEWFRTIGLVGARAWPRDDAATALPVGFEPFRARHVPQLLDALTGDDEERVEKAALYLHAMAAADLLPALRRLYEFNPSDRRMARSVVEATVVQLGERVFPLLSVEFASGDEPRAAHAAWILSRIARRHHSAPAGLIAVMRERLGAPTSFGRTVAAETLLLLGAHASDARRNLLEVLGAMDPDDRFLPLQEIVNLTRIRKVKLAKLGEQLQRECEDPVLREDIAQAFERGSGG